MWKKNNQKKRSSCKLKNVIKNNKMDMAEVHINDLEYEVKKYTRK